MSLITRLFAQPKPPHQLIAPNPRLEHLISSRASLLVLFFVFVPFIIIYIVLITVMSGSTVSRISILPWFLLFTPLIYLSNVFFFSIQLHYWKRIEPSRFIAALSDNHLLADVQPEPNTNALSIPITIKMNSAIERHLSLGYMSLFLLLMMIYVCCFLIMLLPFVLPWFWSLPITALVGVLLLLSFALVGRMRREVEINQEGIRFRIAQGFAFMLWQEARLFACYPEPGPWSNSPAIVYELSSANHVFHWTCVRPGSRLSLLRRLFYPLEKDDTQLQALCSLVAAKTGLPLYDLGKARAEQ